MTRNFPARFFSMVIRKKVVPNSEYVDSSPLKRSLTVFDLCLYGVGAMCGGYIYGVSIVLVATKSGASSFLSNIIAGVVAALNAQCYVELSSRFPVGGGGYSFTYMLCGELLAFITGWAMLLEYLLGFAFAAVGASNAIDLLTNNTLNTAIGNKIGHFPNTYGFLTDTPNLLGAAVAIAIVILLGFGAKISVGVNAIVTIFSTVLLLICSIYMAIYSNLGRFSSYRVLNRTVSTVGRSDWMPFGIAGLLGGAALSFNAFIGFDAMSLTGDVVLNPSRTVPLSTNLAIVIVFCITTFYYLCVSFYLPWFMVNPKLGLSGVFFNQGIFPMQIIAGIGEVTGYVTSGFANMFALSHIVFSLSRDGLLFPFFHYVSKRFQVPIFGNWIFGILAAVMALLFDLNIIANFMSAGTLVTYTIVAIDLLVVRLIDVNKVSTNADKVEVESKFSIKDIMFTPCVEKLCNCTRVVTRPICLVVSLLVLILSCSIASYLGTSYLISFAGRISVVSVCVFFILVSCLVLFLFKYYMPEDGFRVRPVPFVPIICIILNIFLASHLQIIVWGRLGIWILLGLACYIFYGMWHSDLALKEDESKSLVHSSSSKDLNHNSQ